MRCWTWFAFALSVAVVFSLDAPAHAQQWTRLTSKYDYHRQDAAQPQNGLDLPPQPPGAESPHTAEPITSPMMYGADVGCGAPSCGGMAGCGGASCGPTWRFSIDALWLDRNEPGDTVFVTDNATGATLLSGANLSFSRDTGWRFAATHFSDECSACQIVWLSTNWNAGASVTSAVNLNAIAGTLDFLQADTIAIQNSSDLDSFELNKLWLKDGGIGCLAGVRHVTFDDAFRMRATDAGRISDYAIDADSDWWGVQVGVFCEKCLCDGLNFRGQMKMGLGYNDVHQAVLLRDNNNTVTLRNFRNGDSDFTWLAELDLGVTYCIKCLALRAGFELLWLDGVALAPDQFQNNSAAANAAVSANGCLLATGFYAGLEIAF